MVYKLHHEKSPTERETCSFTRRRKIMHLLKSIWEVIADYLFMIACALIGLALLVNAFESARPLEHNEVRLCNDWSFPPSCYVVTVTPSP